MIFDSINLEQLPESLEEAFIAYEKQDQKQFNRSLTRDLILAYMNAFKAGDHETVIELREK